LRAQFTHDALDMLILDTTLDFLPIKGLGQRWDRASGALKREARARGKRLLGGHALPLAPGFGWRDGGDFRNRLPLTLDEDTLVLAGDTVEDFGNIRCQLLEWNSP
jgi:hypothetical protein